MDDKGGNWEICFVAKEEFSFPTLASLELLRSMLREYHTLVSRVVFMTVSFF